MLADHLLTEKGSAIHKEALRLANIYFLRCGRIPSRIKEIAKATAPENTAYKFNPNHDELGRFTFGPGAGDDATDNSDNNNQNAASDQLGNLLQSLLGI